MRTKFILLAAVFAIAAAAFFSPARADGDGGGTFFTIKNGLENYTIVYVRISAADQDEWGPDQLDDDQVLSPGEEETWTIEPGTWDIQCKDNDGDTYTFFDVEIEAGVTSVLEVTLEHLDRKE